MSANRFMLRLCLVVACCAMQSRGQSLGDLARLEAERRRSLEESGVRGRVIGQEEVAGLTAAANVSTFSPSRSIGVVRIDPPRPAGSAAAYRRKLQKLDRDILLAGDRLRDLQAKLVRRRWAPSRSSRGGRSGSGSSEERMRDQVRELTKKLELLRTDRRQIYDEGRRAGFLPGELDGKGIVP